MLLHMLICTLWIKLTEGVVVAPGGSARFSCSFPVAGSPTLTNLIINWQYGDTVVHSFYHGRDQLERQRQSYRGRTRLSVEQIVEGNAALTLNDVQPQHHGEYTCIVNNEHGETKQTEQLVVAAPYDEPKLEINYTCDNVTVILLSSGGFPEPTVSWKRPVGRNITNAELDVAGCYNVQSSLTINLNTTQTIIVEMSLEILSQKFIREITLSPQSGCCSKNAAHMTKRLLALSPMLLIIILLLILITANPYDRNHSLNTNSSLSPGSGKLHSYK